MCASLEVKKYEAVLMVLGQSVFGYCFSRLLGRVQERGLALGQMQFPLFLCTVETVSEVDTWWSIGVGFGLSGLLSVSALPLNSSVVVSKFNHFHPQFYHL